MKLKPIKDEKLLAHIYNKYLNNIPLTKKNLEFIYEVKYQIDIPFNIKDTRKKEIQNNKLNRISKEVTIETIKASYGKALTFLEETKRDNEQFIYSLIKISQEALIYNYATERLKDNEHFALSLIKINSETGRYTTPRLRSKKSFLLEWVKIDGLALKHSLGKVNDDEELALEAIKQDGRAALYISNRLKNNKEFMNKVKKYQNTNSKDKNKDKNKVYKMNIKPQRKQVKYYTNYNHETYTNLSKNFKTRTR